MKNQKEFWVNIPNYENYQVSNLGRVKSLRNKIILKQTKDGRGYYSVTIYRKTIKKNINVHKIVAITFLNNKPDGTTKIVVDHINGNKKDNRLSNLQLITHRQNISKSKKGTSIYTGVSWSKQYQKWASRININKKDIKLGFFDDELDAFIAYKNKLKEII